MPARSCAGRREYYSNFPAPCAEISSKNRKRGKCAALFSSRPLFPSSAFPNSSAQRRDTLLAAAPPDGSRGSRPAPGSRRLSHIRQIAEFSLPCLGVYHWLRTQDSLTPATFRLPHPRPSARRGSIPLVRFLTKTARRFCRGFCLPKGSFSRRKIFYELRLDLRFIWYNGCVKRRGQTPRNADFSGHLRLQPHRNAGAGWRNEITVRTKLRLQRYGYLRNDIRCNIVNLSVDIIPKMWYYMWHE